MKRPQRCGIATKLIDPTRKHLRDTQSRKENRMLTRRAALMGATLVAASPYSQGTASPHAFAAERAWHCCKRHNLRKFAMLPHRHQKN
jgi:hypothetical protein